MTRRLAPGLLLLLALCAPALADNSSQRQAIQARLARLNGQVARTQAKAKTLQSQIDGVSAEIRSVVKQVDAATLRLAPIEQELALREIKLNRLNALFQLQTDRLHFLRRQYGIAIERVSSRLVSIYTSEPADTLALALSARSFSGFLDTFDYAQRIAESDHRIAGTIGSAKSRVRVQLATTTDARASVAAEARAVAFRVQEARAIRDQLVANRQHLNGLKSSRQHQLDSVSTTEKKEQVEIRVLRQKDLQLAGLIQARQTSGPVDTSPSSAGLVWPVSGPITSGFGPRWGGFHFGLDIAANTGTPIHAAAAGTVIYAGWYGGFGNFVIIDHGGGLATTYGHQSQIATSVGAHVAQGDVIGYVGNTGFSTGPHLDFEVRVNGQPVDPLGYL